MPWNHLEPFFGRKFFSVRMWLKNKWDKLHSVPMKEMYQKRWYEIHKIEKRMCCKLQRSDWYSLVSFKHIVESFRFTCNWSSCLGFYVSQIKIVCVSSRFVELGFTMVRIVILLLFNQKIKTHKARGQY